MVDSGILHCSCNGQQFQDVVLLFSFILPNSTIENYKEENSAINNIINSKNKNNNDCNLNLINISTSRD